MLAEQELLEKIANRLWYLDTADDFDTEDMALASLYYTEVMRDIYKRKASQILIIIKEASYVQLAEDQSLSPNPYSGGIDFHQNIRLATRQGYDEARRDMLIPKDRMAWRKVMLETKDGKV